MLPIVANVTQPKYEVKQHKSKDAVLFKNSFNPVEIHFYSSVAGHAGTVQRQAHRATGTGA